MSDKAGLVDLAKVTALMHACYRFVSGTLHGALLPLAYEFVARPL